MAALHRMFKAYLKHLPEEQALKAFSAGSGQRAPTFRQWALQLEYENDHWRAKQWEAAQAAAKDR